MAKQKNSTIRDVAKAAGVSIATVSKYVNGQQTFSDSVEAKLKLAIETLGYSQNPVARSMVTGKTSAIGLAVMDVGNPHHAAVVKGANRIALARGYSLLVVDMEENITDVRPLLEALVRRTDGLVVNVRIPKEDMDWLAEVDKPVIFLGESARQGIVSVGTDNVLVATLLARYLVQQGFTQVAYLGFERASWNTARIKGLRDVFDEAGVELTIFDADAPTSEAGEHAAARVLLGPNRPQVVVACNDLVAIGLMAQARAFGLRIPEDVAFVGVDNISTGHYVSPSLTTVDSRSEEVGEVALRQVLSMIEGHSVPEAQKLEPLLIVRDSAKRVVSTAVDETTKPDLH